MAKYTMLDTLSDWENTLPVEVFTMKNGLRPLVINNNVDNLRLPPDLLHCVESGYLAISNNLMTCLIRVNIREGGNIITYYLPCFPAKTQMDDHVTLPRSMRGNNVSAMVVPFKVIATELNVEAPIKRWNEDFSIYYNSMLGLHTASPHCKINVMPFIKMDWTMAKSGIAGLDDTVKSIITELFMPYVIDQPHVRKPRGLLLYGPPGNGKSLIARAVASILNVQPVLVNGAEFRTRFFGESERKLREALTPPNRDGKFPHIVIIDEIDALVGVRSGGTGDGVTTNNALITEVLTALDGVDNTNNIIMIGTTNRKDAIDPAVLRSGRMSIHKYIPLPNQEARENILRLHLKNYPNTLTDDDISAIAYTMRTTNGADLEDLVRNVANDKQTQMMGFRMDDTGISFADPSDVRNVVLEMDDFYDRLAKYEASMGDRVKVIYYYRMNPPADVVVDIADIEDAIEELFPGDYNKRAMLDIRKRIKDVPDGESFVVTGSSVTFFRFCSDYGYVIIQDA